MLVCFQFSVFLVLISFYTYRSTYYTKHFLPNTEINGINVSDLTVEANEKLKEAYSDKKLAIKEDGKLQEVPKSELGYKDDFTSELSPILNEQNGWTWGMTYVSAAEKQEIDPISQDHQKLDTTVQTLTMKLDTDLNKDRNTYPRCEVSKKSGDSFVIKPEVNGNTINVDDAAVKQIKSAVNSGKDTIELTEFKEKPKVTSPEKTVH